jgi:hypothetical protein
LPAKQRIERFQFNILPGDVLKHRNSGYQQEAAGQ